MSRKDYDDLRTLAESLQPTSGGRGRRSPLFRWFYDRADGFKRLLDAKQPSWDSITTALIKLNLKDASGKPPTVRCAQNTWLAVKQAKGWVKQRQPLPPPAPVAAPSPSAIPVPQPVGQERLNALAEPVDGEDVPAPARTFSTATLRNHVPSIAPSSALPVQSKPQPEPDPDRASRVIEAFLSGAPRNKFKTNDGD